MRILLFPSNGWFLDLRILLDVGGNPDHLVNLIISAAVIVFVIFVGVAIRRPKP